MFCVSHIKVRCRHREACRVANCLDFIEAWDQGFDTVRAGKMNDNL